MSFRGRLGRLLFCASGIIVTQVLVIQKASGQKVVSARAGLISYVQGPAFVDSRRVILRSTRFAQMRNGETLSTGRGRAELLLAPGAFLRISENAQVRMDDTQLSDTRLTLLGGDALIEIVQSQEGGRIQVTLAETITELARPGLYRLGIAQNGTAQGTMRVYGGEAVVRSGLKTALVKRGMGVDLDAGLPVTKFDRKQTDSLHAWAARRSFDLFMSDREARQRQTHWQSTGTYVENKNYGVQFRGFLRRRSLLSDRPTVPSAESR